MAKLIYAHQIDDINKQIKITDTQERMETDGLTSTVYRIEPADRPTVSTGGFTPTELEFQFGDPRSTGLHGLTNESLLAVVENRMSSTMEGKFACKETGLALFALRMCLSALAERAQRIRNEEAQAAADKLKTAGVDRNLPLRTPEEVNAAIEKANKEAIEKKDVKEGFVACSIDPAFADADKTVKQFRNPDGSFSEQDCKLDLSKETQLPGKPEYFVTPPLKGPPDTSLTPLTSTDSI